MVPQQHRRRRRRAAQVRAAERRLIVARGPGGFGFTIAGQRPCVVSDVAPGGPAERAGLRPGDALLAVDGANVSRASHTAVARLVAAAPQSISLSVALRESQPTDTEDTEPDERSRTRRRHPPPRRRLQQPPILHYPGCHSIPSTSGVNELLQNIHRSQMNPAHAACLECRAVIGYLGTIETPQTNESAASSVKTAVRKLRQEKRPATPVLLLVLPNVMFLRRPNGQTLAQYPRERIIHAGCSSDADRRYFGLVTSANPSNAEATGHSCHVFAVDPRMEEHEAHLNRAREFQIPCTRDPVAERCLEFPPSAEYVVGIVKGMYSLPTEDCSSPALQQISKLAIKGDSPSVYDFCRPNRVAMRVPRIGRRPNCGNEMEGQELANSPQPSNHSEITTTSSNSDSGIGFHNDGRNIAERILVVDFGVQQPLNRRIDQPRRPLGMVGSSNFDDGAFLSNTIPVVDAFGGQGRPLNALDDVMLNPNDLNIPYLNRNDELNYQDSYNYNLYSNVPSTSQNPPNGYDTVTVFTENEYQYDFIPPQFAIESELDRVAESLNSVEFYEESRVGDSISNEGDSVEADTVISGNSKASADSVSMYSTRSHEEARPSRVRHMQASLDDMLVIGSREEKEVQKNDDDNFLHPGSIKCKVRKSKPRSLLARTKNMLTSRKESKTVARERAMSASDVARAEAVNADSDAVLAACSEPDLRDSQTEQSSPFRRWTTGSGAGSSYRHDHRSIYNKQMSDLGPTTVTNKCSTVTSGNGGSGGGSVARWSLGLEQLLADPAGASAFAHFLTNEFANENIRFWWSCEQYNQCLDAHARQSQAQEIWQRHLADGAPEPVNIDGAAKRATALRLQYCPEDLFQQAQKQIFNVMKFDSYPRFLRSSVHAECARADLRGLPLPYAPRRDSDNTPSKLKKSASNASERRRSGGTSLLPWRLRAHNKEQSASTQSINEQHCDSEPQNQPPTQTQTQVQPPATNGYTLCRVVLPDGATSVVGVDGAVPVRALLDRLLQRRHVPCRSYDVLCREHQQQKGGVPVDLSAPSTVLGGRCVVVERRCVVRVEISGRCVAVRCRPTRPLRHALTPLLQRYNISPNVATRVMLNGSAVDPDTSMQELDGLRLQVVTTTDAESAASAATRLSSLRQKRDSDATQRDCDAESISDLALRVNDDGDSQSCKSLCRSENGSQSSSNCGLVRAALRPGPPLHHHPPDFLDNLRETQQRLRLQQGRPEPLPAAELRSPPPLPPKPRTIQAPAIV